MMGKAPNFYKNRVFCQTLANGRLAFVQHFGGLGVTAGIHHRNE